MTNSQERPSAQFYDWVNSLNHTGRGRSTTSTKTYNTYFHRTPITDENFDLGRNASLTNDSILIADIVVKNYLYSLGKSDIDHREKQYAGTMVMVAKVPRPTIEEIRARVADYRSYGYSSPMSPQEMKWKEQREFTLSANDNMKGKLMMPVRSKSERKKWLDNIKQTNPDRLNKRVYSYLNGESYNMAVEIIKENSNRGSDSDDDYCYYNSEDSVIEQNPITGMVIEISPISDKQLQKQDKEICLNYYQYPKDRMGIAKIDNSIQSSQYSIANNSISSFLIIIHKQQLWCTFPNCAETMQYRLRLIRKYS